MQDIQSLFSRMKEINEEQRTIRKEYKDLLSHDTEHQRLTEEMKTMREQKKLVESHAQEQMGTRYQRYEELCGEVADLKQMISDIAMTTLMKGESIEVSDEYDTLYEPQFSVSFKKTNAKKIEEEK